MSGRTVLNHCPYCGDDNLWPHEAQDARASEVGGAWECRSCLRAFKVTMIGHLARPTPGGDA